MLSKQVNVAAGAATCFVVAWPINATADIFITTASMAIPGGEPDDIGGQRLLI